MENITIKHILNRRSVRKFKEHEISKEIITELLKAAMNAPSACNQQCWHFIIVEAREVLNELSTIHSGYHTIANTPTAIVVCGEPGKAILPSFWEHDCAAATENILIAAEALGLGAIWQGVNPAAREEAALVSKYLKLPDQIKPFSIVSLGYRAENVGFQDKFNPDKIHFNSCW